jgi:hypothetical protein
MPREDRDQFVGPDGKIISETVVERPERVVSDDMLIQAKQNLRAYWTQFTQDGVPTGTPTANQNRNAILSLIVAARYLYNEMDDEGG